MYKTDKHDARAVAIAALRGRERLQRR